MKDRNKSMFPTSKVIDHMANVTQVNEGGFSKLEETSIRILCAMLENPNVREVKAEDVVAIANKLFDEFEKK